VDKYFAPPIRLARIGTARLSKQAENRRRYAKVDCAALFRNIFAAVCCRFVTKPLFYRVFPHCPHSFAHLLM
jgi:hypothetical protein